jgi:hypothetical protein
MAKKKSRLKKILKTLGKVALAGGAAYGASKLFGGRKPSGFLKSGAAGGASLVPSASDRLAKAKRLMTSDRAYTGKGYDDPIMTGGVGVQGPGARTWDSYLPWNTDRYKKGGRVTGAAKRGFGRALMKGKK